LFKKLGFAKKEFSCGKHREIIVIVVIKQLKFFQQKPKLKTEALEIKKN